MGEETGSLDSTFPMYSLGVTGDRKMNQVDDPSGRYLHSHLPLIQYSWIRDQGDVCPNERRLTRQLVRRTKEKVLRVKDSRPLVKKGGRETRVLTVIWVSLRVKERTKVVRYLRVVQEKRTTCLFRLSDSVVITSSLFQIINVMIGPSSSLHSWV